MADDTAIDTSGRRRILAGLAVLLLLLAVGGGAAWAQQPYPVDPRYPEGGPPLPRFSVNWEQGKRPQDVAQSLQILVLLTVLSLAPGFLVLMTGFTRIIIVLGFLRNALGTQQMPPNQVLLSFALFLTILIMAPIFTRINDEALQPYLAGRITQAKAFEVGSKHMRTFMLRQTREKDIALFVKVAKLKKPRRPDDLPLYVVVPSFAISELKTAFEMGVALFIPFLVIDMVIATILMSMGMMMLPPVLISLPFKILLFVMVDGWHLVVRSLVTSFR